MEFIFPEAATTLTISAQGGATSVTSLSAVSNLKDYDYGLIQADGMDCRYKIGEGSDPSSSSGLVIADKSYTPNLLGVATLLNTKVYGTFNLFLCKRPGKS